MEAPEKLKPCPFCGGEARIEDELEDGGKCISCIRCMACSPVYFDRCENMVPEWNRRASTMPGELAERLKEFQSAVEGWREFDHPEWFCRRTAEYVAELGRSAALAWHEGKKE